MLHSIAPSPPSISVILPTYNVEKYITHCLDSCLKQRFNSVEFIIVDDCGTDASISIAETFALKDPRFRIIYGDKNVGTYLARKKGVAQATGKYILFLDPDDCLQTEALEKLFDLTNKEPTDIVFYSVGIIPKQPITTLERCLPKKNDIPESILKVVFCDTPNISWGTPGKMYSRDVANKAFNELAFIKDRLIFAEDVLFLFSAAAHATSCASLPEELYIYNKNPESITETKTISTMLKHGDQIDIITRYIKHLTHDKKLNELHGALLHIAASKVIGILNSDKELMKRFLVDPQTGKSLYLKSVCNSYKSRSSLKDLTRILLYIFTLTKFKF